VPSSLAVPKLPSRPPRLALLLFLGLALLAPKATGAASSPAAPPPQPLPPAHLRPPVLPDPLPSSVEALPSPSPTLETVRADADAVLRAEAEAYWRLFTSGEPIDPAVPWRGREELLSDRALSVARSARQAGGNDRPAAYLVAWLVGERLAHDAADALRDAARAREEAHLVFADHEIPLRAVPSLLSEERDREKRRALSRVAASAARQIVPLVDRGEDRVISAARDLGYPSSLALATELRGAPAPLLTTLAEGVLSQTEPAWQALLASLARAEGLDPTEVRGRDLPFLLRTRVPPRLFPAGAHLTLGSALLAGVGIELARQANLRLAPEPHPGGPPHSIALAVDPPGDVRLAVAPIAGLDATRAALHELGAAEYWAHLREGPMELRRLGPASVPEAWALLFEEVTGAPAFLVAQGVPDAQARAEARLAAARRIFRARDRAARLLAALARAQDRSSGAEGRLFARAAGCPAEPEDGLSFRLEPDPLLRAAEGLRAELLAAQLEARLAREAGGPAWWRAAAAGAWLVRAWPDSAGKTPEEVSASLGEAALDAGALLSLAAERAAP